MRTKSFLSTLICLLLFCFFGVSCEILEKATSAAEKGLEYKNKYDEEKRKWETPKDEPTAEESPSNNKQQPSTNSNSPKTINKTGGQNNPIALGPNESKSANINGASTSLSNRMADYTITVTGCRGSKSDQSVTIYFTVQHGLADQYLAVRASKCKAFTGGISYSKFATMVGGKKNNNTVPYQVSQSCEATIKFVPPSVQSFESVSVDLYTKNKGSNSGIKAGKLELRNLKVAWQ